MRSAIPVIRSRRGRHARIVAGDQVIDPDLAAAAVSGGLNPLSDRDQDVLRSAAGATVEHIARLLHLSPGTVRNYLSSAIGKTGARNRIEAARTTAQHGWL